MEMLYGIVFAIVLFLVFRAFVLWYWRVNELVDTANNINNNLEKILALNGLEVNTPKIQMPDGVETVAGEDKSQFGNQQEFMKRHGIEWSVLKSSFVYKGNKYKTIEDVSAEIATSEE